MQTASAIARAAVIARHLTASPDAAPAPVASPATYCAAVLGSGMMGPAAAHAFLCDPLCATVRVSDVDQARLDACARALARDPAARSRLALVRADVSTPEGARAAAEGCGVVVMALPQNSKARLAALVECACVPGVLAVVDLAFSSPADAAALRSELAARVAAKTGGSAFVLLGGGVEPGLTEIQARWAAERFARVTDLRIRCGGITARASGPLRYKVVFDSRLPIDPSPSLAVAGGKLVAVPRYSGIEHEDFPGVGRVEAWHQYFMPWLVANVPALRELPRGSQKTYRWPGFADRARCLVRLGLASAVPVPGGLEGLTVRQAVKRIVEATGAQTPLPPADGELVRQLGLDDDKLSAELALKEAGGLAPTPKNLLDAVVMRSGLCSLAPGEQDMTLVTVTADGTVSDGKRRRVVCRMLDRATEQFTSMARTASFTAASIARLAALGHLRSEPLSVVHPEQVLFGEVRGRLLAHLATLGITFVYEERDI